MRVRHPKTLGGFTPEVEFDHHGRFVTHHPAVVPRIDGDRLRSAQFHNAAVGVLDVHLPLRQKSHVGVLAGIAADDRLHVGGPTITGRINDALDTSRANADDVHFDAACAAMFGSANRKE